jgi:hypothetical protein
MTAHHIFPEAVFVDARDGELVIHTCFTRFTQFTGSSGLDPL